MHTDNQSHRGEHLQRFRSLPSTKFLNRKKGKKIKIKNTERFLAGKPQKREGEEVLSFS
jgi:hypothetical protein